MYVWGCVALGKVGQVKSERCPLREMTWITLDPHYTLHTRAPSTQLGNPSLSLARAPQNPDRL